MEGFTPYLPGLGDIAPGRSHRSLKSDLLRHRYSYPSWFLIAQVNALTEDLHAMARARNKGQETVSKPGTFRFINVTIDETAYEEIMERYQDGDALMDAMQRYMEIGYKFSFAVNKQNDMVSASMTDRREGSESENACLTGSSDSWYDALKVVLYKHEVILKSNWSEQASTAAARRRIM